MLGAAADGSRTVCAEPRPLPEAMLSPALTLGHGSGYLACRGLQTGMMNRDEQTEAMSALPHLVVAAVAQDRLTVHLGRDARITLADGPWLKLCDVADAERARDPPWEDADRVANACRSLTMKPRVGTFSASAGERR